MNAPGLQRLINQADSVGSPVSSEVTNFQSMRKGKQTADRVTLHFE